MRFCIRALVDLGFQVDLLTVPFGDDPDLPGLEITRVGNWFGLRDLSIGPSLAKAWFDLLLWRRALRMTRRKRYDVVHCLEDAGVIGALLRRKRIPCFVYDKLSDLDSYRGSLLRNLAIRLYRPIEARTIRAADVVMVGAERLIRHVHHVAPEREVHHVFDIPSSTVEATDEGARAARERLGLDVDRTVALFVGSFTVYQGIDLMFEAIHDVLDTRDDVTFVVIGGRDSEITERSGALAVRGHQGRVIFVPRIEPEELPNFLAAADILLCPRTAGANVPLKLFDYLKVGRAIVATDIPANTAVLDDTMSVLTKPEPREFAAGIVKLLDDAELRGVLGSNGRRVIDERYNYEELRAEIADCYEVVKRRDDAQGQR